MNTKFYADKFYDEFKNKSLQELESMYELVNLYGSDGKGRTAEVPLIKIRVLQNLINNKK